MESKPQQPNSSGMQNSIASAFGLNSLNVATEELPPMRAVTLRGPSSELQFSSAGPTSLGKLPPLGFARPASLSSRGRSSSSLSVRKEWNESNWNVSSLEQVPLGFALERTHREIHGVDAAEVANRISNALRKLSVEAEFDGEHAKAKCTSMDMVNFRIRLFACNEDGVPIIVEVQRRSGPPSSFMSICRQILDAAEGKMVESQPNPCKKMPPFISGPIGGMKCLQSVVPKEVGNAETDALNKSTDLLKSENKSSNILGLENLCLLTDPLKTRPDAALNACKALVVSEDCQDLRNKLCCILQNPILDECDDQIIIDFTRKSRRMALVVVSNAILLTSKNGCLTSAVESQKWISEFLIPFVLEEMKCFHASANNAFEATCILTNLAKCSDTAKRVLQQSGAVEHLRAAYQYGTENHELLANEAEQAIMAMGES